MASNQTLKLPNPLTDLAFLPPDAAWQTQIGRYILVGTLGVALAKRFILFVPTETIGLRLIFGTSFLIRTTITSSSHSIESDWRQSRISSLGMNCDFRGPLGNAKSLFRLWSLLYLTVGTIYRSRSKRPCS
jgi:hypothetical protein